MLLRSLHASFCIFKIKTEMDADTLTHHREEIFALFYCRCCRRRRLFLASIGDDVISGDMKVWIWIGQRFMCGAHWRQFPAFINNTITFVGRYLSIPTRWKETHNWENHRFNGTRISKHLKVMSFFISFSIFCLFQRGCNLLFWLCLCAQNLIYADLPPIERVYPLNVAAPMCIHVQKIPCEWVMMIQSKILRW